MKISTYTLFMSILALACLILHACNSRSEAEKIIDQSIQMHGGKLYENAHISFDFRDIHYKIFKGPHQYEYSREFYADTLGHVKDVLNNSGFTRTVNGEVVDVTAERGKAYSNSVNSVAYFALLPYGLNDQAVYKTQLEESTLDSNSYHVIKITFDQDGGGEDFDDEFLYWIDQETHQIKYMAYSYHTDGGGVRFRKAVHPRRVEGILFLDYENYQPIDANTPLGEMEALYKAGKLELLSEIKLENIEVTF